MADDDESSTDRIAAELERERIRTAELAERVGQVADREALIVQALFDPPDNSIAVAVGWDIDSPANTHNEWPAFRELFPHKLEGVDDELLEAVRCVVRLTTEAIEVCDVEGLRIVAGMRDRLAELETKDARRRRIFSLVEAWLAELQTNPSASRMPLGIRFGLAVAGMPVSDAVEAKMVPEIVANMSKPGRSPWGAPEATVRLMRACGYDDGATEKMLRSRLDEARKHKKKSTAKNS